MNDFKVNDNLRPKISPMLKCLCGGREEIIAQISRFTLSLVQKTQDHKDWPGEFPNICSMDLGGYRRLNHLLISYIYKPF